MSRASELSLIVADRHFPLREELKRRLDSEAGLTVVGLCADAAEAEHLTEQLRPDVLLLELGLADGSGFDTLKRLAFREEPVRVLGLSTGGDPATVVRALRLGARGVIPRNASQALFVESVRTIATGDYWLAPGQLAMIIGALRRSHLVVAQPSQGAEALDRQRFQLTQRELEIIAAITTGESNKEIAERLTLKECTVKHHLASVFDKVGVFSRLQLALFAIHHHLVTLTEFLP
jgi:two-component system, NarL family, nitrate/nitrite response regulator NarL